MHHENAIIAFQFNSIQFIQKQSRSTKVLVCHKKQKQRNTNIYNYNTRFCNIFTNIQVKLTINTETYNMGEHTSPVSIKYQ